VRNVAEVGMVELTKDWYSTYEVAKLLGLSRFAVWYWCHTGKIRAWKTPSGRYKIPREEVERILKEVRGA